MKRKQSISISSMAAAIMANENGGNNGEIIHQRERNK